MDTIVYAAAKKYTEDSLKGTVRYDKAQDLTHEQKSQVRTNIGTPSLDKNGKIPLEQLPDNIGGGSGGVPSWNDLPDKPFYSTTGSVVILESQSATSADMTDMIGAPLYGFISALEDASMTPESFYNEIQVIYDGTSYNLTKKYGEELDAYYFGNGSYFNVMGVNFEDTGEPFSMVPLDEGDGTLMGVFVTNDTSETTHTVAISVMKEIIKPLDIKYLPSNMALGYEEKPFEDIVWDGNTEGLPVVSADVGGITYNAYKVSDQILTKNDILGATVTSSGALSGQTEDKVETASLWYPTENGSFSLCMTLISVIAVPNDTIYASDLGLSMTFPEAGVWFVSTTATGELAYVKSLIGKSSITPIDEKFIPDTIARQSDLSAYYTKSETYSKSEINTALDNVSVDLSNYYTKTEVDTALDNVSVDLSEYYTKTEINEIIGDVNTIIDEINTLIGE